MLNRWWARCALALCWVAAPVCCFAAQAGNPRAKAAASELALPPVSATVGALSGIISDPSGAKIREATVHIQNASLQRDATTDNTGRFSLPLPLGIYDVTVIAAGFQTYSTNITLTARATQVSIDARLAIATQEEQITVQSENAAGIAAADNRSALIFKGDELRAFSDDDSTFQQEVLAMAGGTGPNPPEILVDGFANGRFPPKNTIREIHINQNPYSVQYDSLGFGRVEVFTKPGTEKLHGNFTSSGTDNIFDSRNPYICAAAEGCVNPVEPPYSTLNLDGNLSGAINKKTSFFVSGTYNDLQNNAIVNATLLTPLSEAVPAPQRTQTYSGRLDRQVTANNTFTARYEYNQVSLNNGGIGLLVLPTEGLNTTTTTQTLQLTDTQLIGPKIVSEAHFQYIRTRLDQSSVSAAPAIVIEGAANGGGNPAQTLRDNQDRYEFQEALSIERGKHFFRIGGRYRLLRDANLSTANYNGQFTFPTLTDYQLTAMKCLDTTTPPCMLDGNAFGPTQFNLTNGQPSAVVLTGDLGVYAEDEWKVRPDLTLSYGFRFESQSAVPDHVDPAPRAGFAWAVGQKAKKQALFVLRGGGGLFYDRFASTNILTAIRQQSGTTQPSYYIQNPPFYTTDPTVFATQKFLSKLSSTPPTLYNIDPHLRTEYSLVGGLTLDRNIGRIGSISANYIYIRGNHQYLSRNINAPLPGTYNPADPTSGVRPLGGTQNIYQFGSGGISKENLLSASIQLQPTKRISLFAFSFYTPSNKNDTSSATSLPSNQYDPSVDFGRVLAPRFQLFTGPNLQLPFGITGGVFFALQSHAPFNITTGTDLNGDTIYNDRPAFATNPTANSVIYKTRFGTFDANPQPGEAIIPINYGDGPGYVFLSVNLSKEFKFGPRPAAPPLLQGAPASKGPVPKPDRPYSLSFAIEADNILNHVNPGPPVGVLGSPYFGQSISLNMPSSLGALSPSANRTITLRSTFSF
jgi:Carboxypeptidase regulatory-like domain